MSKLIRIALIVVILACLGSGYLAFRLDTMKKAHLAKIANLESTLDQTRKTLAQTEADLTKERADHAATRNELATANANLQARAVELAQRTDELNATKSKLAETEQQLQTAQTELASAKADIQKIRDALKEVGITDVADIQEVAKKMANQIEENKVLAGELEKRTKQVADLEAEVVKLSTTPVPIRGKVVGVRSDWNFVVIDLGHKDRIQTNSQFLVYRDNHFVGKVQITSVQATTSVAEILPDYRKGIPREGDLVVH